MRNPQLNRQGELNHLITTEGLSRAILTRLLDEIETCQSWAETGGNADSSSHARTHTGTNTGPHTGTNNRPLLQDKRVTICSVETMSRSADLFERAATSLCAEVIRCEWSGSTALARLRDTQTDLLVMDSAQSGTPYLVAQHIAPHVHVINAGDGCHAEPIQALSDMHTIRRVKKDFSHLTVVLVADMLHSRVARSNIHALTTLGAAEVRVVAPKTLLPEGIEQLGVRVYTDLCEGLRDADVVMAEDMLPESFSSIGVSESLSVPTVREHLRHYGLTTEKLAYAKPDCLVMMEQSRVENLATHQAVMAMLAGTLR